MSDKSRKLACYFEKFVHEDIGLKVTDTGSSVILELRKNKITVNPQKAYIKVSGGLADLAYTVACRFEIKFVYWVKNGAYIQFNTDNFDYLISVIDALALLFVLFHRFDFTKFFEGKETRALRRYSNGESIEICHHETDFCLVMVGSHGKKSKVCELTDKNTVKTFKSRRRTFSALDILYADIDNKTRPYI